MVKRMLVVVGLAAFCAVGQNRVETFRPADIQVTDVRLSALPDGGCSAVWCGHVQSVAGDSTRASCVGPIELTVGANQNACNVLLTGGAPLVLRSMNFAVDGGRQ